MPDVCTCMYICVDGIGLLNFCFSNFVFQSIHYVCMGSPGRIAILAECVTLLKYCVNKKIYKNMFYKGNHKSKSFKKAITNKIKVTPIFR